MQLEQYDRQTVNLINSFSFYLVKEENALLVFGDKFGTLTGISCEKAGR